MKTSFTAGITPPGNHETIPTKRSKRPKIEQMSIFIVILSCLMFLSCEEMDLPASEEMTSDSFPERIHDGQTVTSNNDRIWTEAVTKIYLTGYCTGLLISPRLILTAKHCSDVPYADFYTYDSSGGIKRETASIIDRWDYSDPNVDISLRVLENAPTTQPYWKPAQFADNSLNGKILEFAGFGETSPQLSQAVNCSEINTEEFNSTTDVVMWHTCSFPYTTTRGTGGDSGASVFTTDGEVVGVHRGHVDTLNGTQYLAWTINGTRPYYDWIHSKIQAKDPAYYATLNIPSAAPFASTGYSSTWNTGWTITTYETSQGTFFNFYNKSTGTAIIQKIAENGGSYGPLIASGTWQTGVDVIPFETTQDTFLAFYNKSSGAATISRVNSNGTIGSQKYSGTWSPGWTVKPYTTSQGTFFLFYNPSTGRAIAHPISTDGSTFYSRAIDSTWWTGWDINPFTTPNGTFLNLYRKSTGQEYIFRINANGSLGSATFSTTLSTNLDIDIINTGDDTFVTQYNPSTGKVDIQGITAAADGLNAKFYSATWWTGWDINVFNTGQGSFYNFYRTNTGTAINWKLLAD